MRPEPLTRSGRGPDDVAVVDGILTTASRPDWWGVEGSVPLLVLVVAAGIGTGILFAVSLVAYRRRRSSQYLLISVAVGALWFRSVVGAATVLGYVPMPVHHFVEHSLDFLIAAVVLYAVYAHAPGTVRENADHDDSDADDATVGSDADDATDGHGSVTKDG